MPEANEMLEKSAGRETDAQASQRIREDLRRKVLNEGPERAAFIADHPIHLPTTQILTNSIKEAYLKVLEDLKFFRNGTFHSADFRVGKSTAMLKIMDILARELPNVAFSYMSAQDIQKNVARNFWGDVLTAFGLDTSGNAQDRQKRVRLAMLAACNEVGGKHFCLFIDEAQNMKELEFTALRDLSNHMQNIDKYILSTKCWGDPRLDQLSADFRANRIDLWNRFLMIPQRFAGVQGLKDLEFFMKEHDSPKRCEYPVGSGLSFSEFHLPLAFSEGWRLASEATNLWDAFSRAAEGVGRATSNVGMAWDKESVRSFLVLSIHKDSRVFRSEAADWDVAVDQSNYIGSLV